MTSKELRASRRQEKRVAERIEGKRNAASGAFWTRRGDVRSPELLIECKWTGRQQITLSSRVLEKIVVEAIAEGRQPVLGIELNGKNYIIVPEDDYIETRERLAARELGDEGEVSG